MRGRNNNGGGNNNNNRRGPNPLTRNYESNGPDVKIRGSAQQIAEKYATLARDAQSAGDRVMAENYLQHAEHYNRIIAAAQAQMPIQQVQNNRDDIDDDADQDRDDFEAVNGTPNHANRQNGNQVQAQEQAAPQPADDGSGPQPVIDGTPAEVALKTETPAAANPARGRGRRPAPKPVAQESDAPVAAETAAPAVEAVADEKADEAKEEAAAAPRRSRRPRRGERRSDEGAAAAANGDEAGANEAGAEAPAADMQTADSVLTAANN